MALDICLLPNTIDSDISGHLVAISEPYACSPGAAMENQPEQYDPQAQECQRQRMAALLGQLAPVEGYNLTVLPDIRFLRSNRPLKSVPVLYDPGIVIVCQGKKRAFRRPDLPL